MKKSVLKIAILFLMTIICNQLVASNYYFSHSSGDDSRTSSQAQDPNTPWKSISKLNTVFATLRPGDAVYFKRGDVFFGTIHLNRSGTAGKPIKISAYGSGPKPVITSLLTLDQWRSVGGGKFESQNVIKSSDVKVVLINDQIYAKGRFPNSDSENEGYITIEAVSGNSIQTNVLAGTNNWGGGEVVIKKNEWVVDTEAISAHNGNRVIFKSTASLYPARKGYGFFIQNHIETLDQYGEWYYDTSKRKMTVYFGAKNPSSFKIQVSVLDNLLTKSYGASYIQFEDLSFKGANRDAIFISGGKGINFSRVHIESSGESGLTSLSVLDLVIENSNIKNNLNNGLFLRYGNMDAVIKGNIVENSGIFPGAIQNGDGTAIGIYAVSDNIRIENNKVLSSGYSGIYFGGNNTAVKNNLVENFCLIKNDGGGIYTFDGSSTSKFKNREITSNIVLNAIGSWGGTPNESLNSRPLAEGIFLDDNSSGIKISGNTVANARNNALKMSNVSDIIIEGNTFFDAGSLITLGNNSLGRDVRNVAIQNNIFFSKAADQNAYTIKSIKDDIRKMGEFGGNYFFRPLGDEFSIYSEYQGKSGTVVKNENLKRWQNSSNLDLTSKSNVVHLEKFKVVKKKGPNLLEKGDFEKSIKGITVNNAASLWVKDKGSKGSLKIVAQSKSSVVFNLGGLKKDKRYQLRLNGSADDAGAIRVYLRHFGAPWETLSHTATFELKNKVSEYKTLFSPHENTEKTVIMLASDDEKFTYWIEDLELVEVEVKEVNPDEQILFEYNASHSSKSIILDGTYIDAKNKKHTGSVTIKPFGSIVLVKTTFEVGEPIEADQPEGEIRLALEENRRSFTEGTSLKLYASITDHANEVEKVNFYYGLKIIGSSSTSPYEFNWTNIPAGKHYLWASAVDKKGIEISSKEIDIIVESAQAKFPVDKGEVTENVIVGKSYYYNTTTSGNIRHESNEFATTPQAYLLTKGTNVSTNTKASTKDLFQKARFAQELKYAIPLPNGTYMVQTYHMETYYGKTVPSEKAGQRVFDIYLEGNLVKDDFDMFLENGNKETVLTFMGIVVKDGMLNLDMVASANNATLSAVVILQVKAEEKSEEIAPQVVYYNTTVNKDVIYQNANYSGLSGDYLLSSGTNVGTNISASPEQLFQRARFGSTLSYGIPLANGTYTIETYHVETYFGLSGRSQRAGQRVFDIYLESKLVKGKFDMFVENGNKNTVLTFTNVVVKDGVLNLEMEASVNNATLSAIKITPEVTVEEPKKSVFKTVYYNTTVNKDVVYQNANYSGLSGDYLLSSGTNVGTNISASHEQLFQRARFGSTLSYGIPLANGTYTIETYHVETYFGLSGRSQRAGQRVFDIYLEKKLVKDKFDMFVENGNKNTVLTFTNVVVKDGVLNLDMEASVNNATISAIVIRDNSSDKSKHLRLDADKEKQAFRTDESISRNDRGDTKVKIYPNPAVSETILNVDGEIKDILIYDMNGQLLRQFDPEMLAFEAGKYRLPLDNLSAGLYIVTIVGAREMVDQLRLVVTP